MRERKRNTMSCIQDIPEDSNVIVYYKDLAGYQNTWEGIYRDCPFDTVNSDWYLLDKCESADVLIINYDD